MNATSASTIPGQINNSRGALVRTGMYSLGWGGGNASQSRFVID